MTKPGRSGAHYIRTLVYMDEPQLILLKRNRANVIALAIPSSEGKAEFLAVTVSKKDYEAYIDGLVDLRYLYTYPINRTVFTFDLMELKGGKVMMTPWEEQIPDNYLPSPRFFSSNHTELEENNVADPHVEKLVVDGDWDMPDFGDFYSRYSNVYYLLSASHAFSDDEVDLEKKKEIKKAFGDIPFRGGSSYVHFYKALPGSIPRAERLRMDKIVYQSPGYVSVHGDADAFSETEALIRAFLGDRAAIKQIYDKFHEFLSKNRFLAMPADQFLPTDAAAAYIKNTTNSLVEKLHVPNAAILKSLVNNNELAFAKIILSLYRRLDEASRFFAQGRVNFASSES
ncbi:hypothetical protein [Tardiphaga robiniae]|uniref:Uncharacterized protein n=1 Tax=Tardiphaga robiniae TaxID=943830 RepID=A0A163Z149_9BRAD|nr:hypothetical protein [Tardiphaga robiniae]KZD22799.1 hypothetical protein A4A58_28070 [Tardiphaga robiniae]